MKESREIKAYEIIERHCMVCGELVLFPTPKKKNGGELVYSCSVCSMPYRVKSISRIEVIPTKYAKPYWVTELSISMDFSATDREFGEGNSPINSKYFMKNIQNKKKRVKV